jgi:transcriptional regulator with XRE-family HTH domain
MANIERIRAERKRKGLSQWALAVRVGRSGTWLSLREAGYVRTSEKELKVLLAALKE